MSLTARQTNHRATLGSAHVLARETFSPLASIAPQPMAVEDHEPAVRVSTDLRKSLAEVKGQAQFLLYLADQIEDSLDQIDQETDDCQSAFLSKILAMYSSQFETKHQGLGDKIAETCQEVYITVREFDVIN